MTTTNGNEAEMIKSMADSYDLGFAKGESSDPTSSNFLGAWQWCDKLGIARDSRCGRMFTAGFLDALKKARTRQI